MEGVEIRAALYTVHPGKLEKVLAVLKEHWPEWEEEGALALHQNSKILSKLEIENHKGNPFPVMRDYAVNELVRAVAKSSFIEVTQREIP